MSRPQSAILPEPSESALFVVLRLRDRRADLAPVARAVARFPALTRALAKPAPRARLVSSLGIGVELWDLLSPDRRPRGFRPFRALRAGGRNAPASGGDLLLHVVSKRRDLCFELATQFVAELGDRVEVMDEVQGFRYLDSRDLTGFIDGTENPRGPKKRASVALIGAEDRAFAGGSFVLTQRYVHDLAKWADLAVRGQEQIIGRRKRDSRELAARAKPSTAHISRVVLVEEGRELEIVRHSFPYGTLEERGLFFIAYNRELDTFEKMLSRMLGTAADGLHDHLLHFTRAVSGAYFFAPSLSVLRALGRAHPGRGFRKPAR